MELALVSKRKYGFVTGGEKKDESDKVKAEAWDICHNVVLSWLVNGVSEQIKKSIMFVTSAEDIWKQLQMRFSVANGPRRYKLNKQIYEMKQNGRKISEYYTEMRSIWEELDSLRDYQAIQKLTPDVSAHLNARKKDEEEQKLFQLLSGLDDAYSAQRSHILMMDPLPSIVSACGILQQEESQREINLTLLIMKGWLWLARKEILLAQTVESQATWHQSVGPANHVAKAVTPMKNVGG